MSPFTLLADANDPMNVWLTEHPVVLGLIALAIRYVSDRNFTRPPGVAR